VTRRRLALLAGAAVILLVGAGIVGYAVTRPTGTAPTEALGPPRFVDETATAGIDLTYDGPVTFATGGGVAALDCDDDGRPDLYVAGGAGPAALYRNESPTGGALRFTRVPDAATDLVDVLGAYPLDVDGDGHADLAVLRAGEPVLLRGLGGCRFERGNERWGFAPRGGDIAAFAATWEGAAALPTLAVGRYEKLDASGAQTLECDTSSLLRPAGDGSRYGDPIELAPGYCTLSMVFTDWDRSGRRDLRVTNDRNYYVDGSDQLWRVAPGEAPRLYTADDGWVALQVFGMGLATYDVTGDDYPDVYITSQGDNKLQTLSRGPAQPTYRDIAAKRGVTSAQPAVGGDVRPSTSWHPEFRDVNNDGFVDLLVTKGNVSAQADHAEKDPSDLFLGQPDGTFVNAAEAAGIVTFDRGRGAALVDLNLDGLVDLVEVHYSAPVRLWRNAGAGDSAAPAAMGHWLAIRPSQAGPDRDAIGAWIEVKTGEAVQRREVVVGGGHAGGQLGWTHVGLGPSEAAEVRVIWPDGTEGPGMKVAADTFVGIERGAAAPRPWQPPAGG
jgi:hypothetical protein